eukprot:gene12961-8817_t
MLWAPIDTPPPPSPQRSHLLLPSPLTRFASRCGGPPLLCSRSHGAHGTPGNKGKCSVSSLERVAEGVEGEESVCSCSTVLFPPLIIIIFSLPCLVYSAPPLPALVPPPHTQLGRALNSAATHGLSERATGHGAAHTCPHSINHPLFFLLYIYIYIYIYISSCSCRLGGSFRYGMVRENHHQDLPTHPAQYRNFSKRNTHKKNSTMLIHTLMLPSPRGELLSASSDTAFFFVCLFHLPFPPHTPFPTILNCLCSFSTLFPIHFIINNNNNNNNKIVSDSSACHTPVIGFAPFLSSHEQEAGVDRAAGRHQEGQRDPRQGPRPASWGEGGRRDRPGKASHEALPAAVPAPSTPVTPAQRAAVKQFLEAVPLDVDLEETRRLQLANKGLATLPAALGGVLQRICSLDLSHNALLGDELPLFACLPRLSNLNLSHNAALGSLGCLSHCTGLVVLTVAHCGLRSLKGVEGSGGSLKTLIANDNSIALFAPAAVEGSAPRSPAEAAELAAGVETFEALVAATGCEVLVLSRNPRLCYEEPRTAAGSEPTATAVLERDAQRALADRHPLSVLERLPALKKVSMSQCGLRSLPARLFLPRVTELRLSHNAFTNLQPESCIARSLQVLDVSHNLLDNVATLRRFKFLKQVNLRGNPAFDSCIAQDTERGYENASRLPPSLKKSLLHLFPALQRIDGVSTAEPDPPRSKPKAAPAKETKAGTKSKQKEEPQGARVTPTRSQQEGQPEEQDRSWVTAEAEQRDTVMEVPAPEPVVAPPVVRRERRHLDLSHRPPHAAPLTTGTAAVSQVLAHKNLFQGGCRISGARSFGTAGYPLWGVFGAASVGGTLPFPSLLAPAPLHSTYITDRLRSARSLKANTTSVLWKSFPIEMELVDKYLRESASREELLAFIERQREVMQQLHCRIVDLELRLSVAPRSAPGPNAAPPPPHSAGAPSAPPATHPPLTASPPPQAHRVTPGRGASPPRVIAAAGGVDPPEELLRRLRRVTETGLELQSRQKIGTPACRAAKSCLRLLRLVASASSRCTAAVGSGARSAALLPPPVSDVSLIVSHGFRYICEGIAIVPLPLSPPMEFVLVPSTNPRHEGSLNSIRRLSAAQLLRAAAREGMLRTTAFPGVDVSGGDGLLSGAALRSLCLLQLSEQEVSQLGDVDPEQLHGVWLDNYDAYGIEGKPLGCKVLAAKNLATHHFPVKELLHSRGLLLLTASDNLEPFAQASGAAPATPREEEVEEEADPAQLSIAAPTADTSPAQSETPGEQPVTTPGSLLRDSQAGVRRGRDGDFATTPTSLVSGVGVLPAKRLHREAVFETVPASVRHTDIEAVNELIDSGLPERIRLIILPYACRECTHLPQFTLTMSCCGAVLCSRCVPSPPTVTDIAMQERLCPVCGEEPLEPPQSHPARDEQVHRLVKELKVLYHVQLKEIALGQAEGIADLGPPAAPASRLSPFSLLPSTTHPDYAPLYNSLHLTPPSGTLLGHCELLSTVSLPSHVFTVSLTSDSGPWALCSSIPPRNSRWERHTARTPHPSSIIPPHTLRTSTLLPAPTMSMRFTLRRGTAATAALLRRAQPRRAAVTELARHVFTTTLTALGTSAVPPPDGVPPAGQSPPARKGRKKQTAAAQPAAEVQTAAPPKKKRAPRHSKASPPPDTTAPAAPAGATPRPPGPDPGPAKGERTPQFREKQHFKPSAIRRRLLDFRKQRLAAAGVEQAPDGPTPPSPAAGTGAFQFTAPAIPMDGRLVRRPPPRPPYRGRGGAGRGFGGRGFTAAGGRGYRVMAPSSHTDSIHNIGLQETWRAFATAAPSFIFISYSLLVEAQSPEKKPGDDQSLSSYHTN